VIVEGLEFVARVVCASGERLTPWRCQDKAATRVGGVWRCDINAVPVGRCQVVYCITVDV
jgi:hypothetical protein